MLSRLKKFEEVKSFIIGQDTSATEFDCAEETLYYAIDTYCEIKDNSVSLRIVVRAIKP